MLWDFFVFGNKDPFEKLCISVQYWLWNWWFHPASSLFLHGKFSLLMQHHDRDMLLVLKHIPQAYLLRENHQFKEY